MEPLLVVYAKHIDTTKNYDKYQAETGSFSYYLPKNSNPPPRIKVTVEAAT